VPAAVAESRLEAASARCGRERRGRRMRSRDRTRVRWGFLMCC
jgi:hypothetical protein